MIKKGEHIGKEFSKEHQPSGEAKSRGKREAINARNVMRQALQAEVTDEHSLKVLRQIFPGLEHYTGYHMILGRLYTEAMKGNIRALESSLKVSGDWEDKHSVEVKGTQINIQTSPEGAELLNKIAKEK